MSSLEHLLSAAGEAPLMNSLDFTLPPSSSAVIDRKQHKRAYPSSASTLSPTGTKTCRIRLGGEEFIDPKSVRLMFKITEKGGQAALTPTCGPWGVWDQVFLRSGGCQLDDVPAYGRMHQQFLWNHLSQDQQYGEAGICGFAGSEAAATSKNLPQLGTIAVNGSYTVMHRLGLSLFNSDRMIPCRYAPLEIELTLGAAANWLAAATSQTYEITDAQVLYDSYQMDSAIEESFYKAMLASRTLSVPVMNVTQIVQSIPPGSTSYSFNVARSFSRLSHIWLTFRNNAVVGKSSSFICPLNFTNNAGAAPALSDQSPTARLSLGPKNLPDPQPVATVPELFYQFQKAIPNIPNINRDDFLTRAFTLVFDLRRVPEDPTTALSSRSGDQIHVDLQNITADHVNECWCTIFSFGVVAVRESGVTLLN